MLATGHERRHQKNTKIALTTCLTCLICLIVWVRRDGRNRRQHGSQRLSQRDGDSMAPPLDQTAGASRLADNATVIAYTSSVKLGRNRVAVFTIVRNEAFFLPVWLRHYGCHFHRNDIYVLDNGSTDGSTRAVAAHVVSRPSSYFNDLDWLRHTVTTFQVELLRSGYDYVLFAEVDELVVATREGGLGDYLAHYTGVGASVTAYEIVHDIFAEDDLDTAAPITLQRSLAVRVTWWDKPLLTSVPIVYCKGFHVCLDGCTAPRDDTLLLFHLHRVDFKACYERLNAKATRENFKLDEEKNQGVQQHFTGRQAAAYCLEIYVHNKTTHVNMSSILHSGTLF